jgi:hypothetical protein
MRVVVQLGGYSQIRGESWPPPIGFVIGYDSHRIAWLN